MGTLATMWSVGDVLANEPVYVGLVAALIAFVAVSLITPRTPANIMAIWIARSSGKPEPESEATPVPVAIA